MHLDTATGVLQVQIHSARGIKGAKLGGGTPDPYVSLNIENRKELARTRFKASTYVNFLLYLQAYFSHDPLNFQL